MANIDERRNYEDIPDQVDRRSHEKRQDKK